MAKTLTSVYLDTDDYEAFKAQAQQTDKSVSALMRHVIGIYLQAIKGNATPSTAWSARPGRSRRPPLRLPRSPMDGGVSVSSPRRPP
jgi:hypothetical protein